MFWSCFFYVFFRVFSSSSWKLQVCMCFSSCFLDLSVLSFMFQENRGTHPSHVPNFMASPNISLSLLVGTWGARCQVPPCQNCATNWAGDMPANSIQFVGGMFTRGTGDHAKSLISFPGGMNHIWASTSSAEVGVNLSKIFLKHKGQIVRIQAGYIQEVGKRCMSFHTPTEVCRLLPFQYALISMCSISLCIAVAMSTMSIYLACKGTAHTHMHTHAYML